MATKQVENYTGTRITFHSTQPYDSILTSLYSSIGSLEKASAWREFARSFKGYSAEGRDRFVAATEKQAGPHGFTIFEVQLPFLFLPLPSPLKQFCTFLSLSPKLGWRND
jgi:hypothetical protein